MAIAIIIIYLVGVMVTLGYMVTHFESVKVTSDIDDLLHFFLAMLGSIFWFALIPAVFLSFLITRIIFRHYF